VTKQIESGFEVGRRFVAGHPLAHDGGDFLDHLDTLGIGGTKLAGFDALGLLDGGLNLMNIRAVPGSQENAGGVARGGRRELHRQYIS